MERINTEQIIREIEEEVRDFPTSRVKFSDLPTGNEPVDLLPYQPKAVNNAFRTMRKHANVVWYRSLRPGFRGVIEKVVRKMVTFLIAPISEEQSRFNYSTENTIERLYALVLEQQKRIEELESKLEDTSL